MPFFLLLTVALAWMYVIYVGKISSPWRIALFTVLLLVHLGLYWSVLRFMGSQRSLRLYLIVQGLLAFMLILFGGDYGLAIGLYASLIGNTVGVLRTSKDLFYFVPYYIVLALTAIVLQSGIDVVLEWAQVAIPSILFSVFVAFLFRRMLEAREETQILLENLQEAHARLETYAAQVEELTLVEERQRIARELHDTLAQELTGVVLQLEAVSTHIEKQNNARAQEILQDAMAQSRVTLAEARKVIDGLRTNPQGKLSMEEAVRHEVDRFQRVAQIPCSLEFDLQQPLDAEWREHLLKIISEGLNNIAKHAEANQSWLRLTEGQGRIWLEILDDGRGFVPDETVDGRYGLLGIEERVEMMSGVFWVSSKPGEGTELHVEIPVG
ncbi:MAG: sensor histidine kinase [Anaerolineales bacterium]